MLSFLIHSIPFPWFHFFHSMVLRPLIFILFSLSSYISHLIFVILSSSSYLRPLIFVHLSSSSYLLPLFFVPLSSSSYLCPLIFVLLSSFYYIRPLSSSFFLSLITGAWFRTRGGRIFKTLILNLKILSNIIFDAGTLVRFEIYIHSVQGV